MDKKLEKLKALKLQKEEYQKQIYEVSENIKKLEDSIKKELEKNGIGLPKTETCGDRFKEMKEELEKQDRCPRVISYPYPVYIKETPDPIWPRSPFYCGDLIGEITITCSSGTNATFCGNTLTNILS